MNNGFTDPASPLVCELDDTIDAIRRLLEAARRAEIPVVYTTVSYGEGDKVTAKAFIEKVPALLTLEAGLELGRDRRADRARVRTSRC